MPLCTTDDETARMVSTRAELGGLKKDCAVEIAVKAELGRAVQAMPLRERFAALRALHPLPPPAGEVADKAFFDDLSGE
jgi:antitoxin VapB